MHFHDTYFVIAGFYIALSFAETEVEKKMILLKIELDKALLAENIDLVLFTVNSLIEKLRNIDNLHSLLSDNGTDTLNNQYYFSAFNVDPGNRYIGNNFGQDLRNFRRFLEYAKSKGSMGVHFLYG